ncbi:MAG: hypothetical protein HYR48_00980 [Gemmatimonadetes bacterium]|nr:hypothetical protein [Gemmatimonadota bacterium]
MTPYILVVVVGIIALAGILWLANRLDNRLQQQRIAELEQVARVMQFSFAREEPQHLWEAVSGIPFCKAGLSREWRNVMTGKVADRDAVLGEFSYKTGTTIEDAPDSYEQTVAVFPNGASGLPDFTLAPPDPFYTIKATGHAQIDLEASEEFPKYYLLCGEDEVAIRRAFNADAMAFFPRNAGWSVQTSGGSIAVFRHGKRCKPKELPAFLADALRIQDSFSRASTA